MHLEHLHLIAEIARLHSISRAAETLHISQPALSVTVKNLESELGRTLFRRTNKGTFLTAEGKKIHDEAVAILEVINSWYAKCPRQEIHLACMPSIATFLTPNIIVPFQKLHPNITVFVHNSHLYDISKLYTIGVNMVLAPLSGHAKVMEQVRSMGWKAHHLFSDERRLIIGANHPLAKKNVLRAEDLKQLTLAYYSDMQDHVLHNYLPYFSSSFRLANKEDILELVIKNMAVFFQPYCLFRHDYRMQTNIVVDRVVSLPNIDSKVEIFALCVHDLSTLENMFFTYLIEHFTDSLCLPRKTAGSCSA